MRAIYHIYPTESSPGESFLFTPPESPDLDPDSNPLDAMAGFTAAVCSTCDKEVQTERESCSSCHTASQGKASLDRSSFALTFRAGKQLTPPPSQPSSPRRSLEEDDEEPTPMPRRTRARISYANEALSSAFSSQPESSSSLFPRSFFRHLERTGSEPRTTFRRTTSTASSDASVQFTSSATASVDKNSPIAPLSRSTTPEMPAAGYAPMAAGFARLSRKDAHRGPDHARRMCSTSSRPSMALEARMFDGPA